MDSESNKWYSRFVPTMEVVYVFQVAIVYIRRSASARSRNIFDPPIVRLSHSRDRP